jgi:hypothetical protein
LHHDCTERIINFESQREKALVDFNDEVAGAEVLADWVARYKLRSRETDSISARRTK